MSSMRSVRRRRSRRDKAAKSNALPRRGRRGRRAGDGRRVGTMLWRDMGNPIFPLFNAVFRSPELVPTNIMDWQFLPRGYAGRSGLSLLTWLLGDNRSSEYPFRDARFAVATVLILFGIGRGLIIRADIFTRRDIPVSAFLHRLLRDMAHPVCDSALRDRSGAFVRAADRPADPAAWPPRPGYPAGASAVRTNR